MQFLEGVDPHDPFTFRMSEGINCDKLQGLHIQNVFVERYSLSHVLDNRHHLCTPWFKVELKYSKGHGLKGKVKDLKKLNVDTNM